MSRAGAVVSLFVLATVAACRRATQLLERRTPRPLPRSGGEIARWSARSPHRNPISRRRERRRFDRQLPEAMAAVARGLRSGGSLRYALADAAGPTPEPLGGHLRDLVASVEAGAPLTAALDTWAQACPDSDVPLAAAALSLAEETGGPSAQAVDGVAATLRRRLAGRDEAVALSAQARLSAVVLVALPPAVCLLTLAGGGGPARFLLGSPAGALCLVGGLALDLLGAWWMARLTRSAPPRSTT